MPTYVYRFVDVDATFEVQQAFTDPPLTEAVYPGDGQVHPVKKVFTPVGITFKGSGFYKTDSRSSSSSTASSSSSSASPTPAPSKGDGDSGGSSNGSAATSPSGTGTSTSSAAASTA
jgi:predicted nucleic acid-binding Zn ribbon protein